MTAAVFAGLKKARAGDGSWAEAGTAPCRTNARIRSRSPACLPRTGLHHFLHPDDPDVRALAADTSLPQPPAPTCSPTPNHTSAGPQLPTRSCPST